MKSEGGGAREAERGRRSEGGRVRKQVWAGAGANRGWQVDGPEQIEAERMGGSGDGRWASSSSVADRRGCGVACCVFVFRVFRVFVRVFVCSVCRVLCVRVFVCSVLCVVCCTTFLSD